MPKTGVLSVSAGNHTHTGKKPQKNHYGVWFCLFLIVCLTVFFAGCTGERGHQGIQGVPGTPGINGDAGNMTMNLTANMTPGPQGIQGIPGIDNMTAGPQGIQGVNGTPGDPGPTGETGSPGAPGAAATADVNATFTLAEGFPATVVNIGTTFAALFDFGIPTGATGATGPMNQTQNLTANMTAGEKGDKGDTGLPFDASAYLPLNGTVPMAGILSMGGFNISNLLDPVAAQDATTKNYVDAVGQAWAMWTPTLAWGTATPTGITTKARWTQIGRIVFYSTSIYATDSNGCTSLTITSPKAGVVTGMYPPSDGHEQYGVGLATRRDPLAYYDPSLDKIYFNDFAAGTDEQPIYIAVSGSYEVS